MGRTWERGERRVTTAAGCVETLAGLSAPPSTSLAECRGAGQSAGQIAESPFRYDHGAGEPALQLLLSLLLT